MGGKADDNVAPPQMPPQMPDQSANIAIMEQMVGMMGMLASQQPQAPQIPDTPTIAREPIINWAEKNQELLAKTKADYTLDSARRKGRTDTILTSPLLDEEETTTTTSLIAGS